ncbi:hypothetical protein G6L37_07225 [Agrobacterium rubi]|nr:hypothetical protein [Agrobacterium rubi]NTF25158.1 hypothetical protein [Agrobacterium rubi]
MPKQLRTYEIRVSNSCQDLRKNAPSIAIHDAIKASVRMNGLTATILFEWEWVVDTSAFRFVIYEESGWMLTESPDLFAQLSEWSKSGFKPSPQDVEAMLSNLGFKEEQTAPSWTYVGRVAETTPLSD